MATSGYGSFDALSPALAIEAVEEAFGLRLDGTISAFPSYVNRVYGLRCDTGERHVAKFYRPDRWSAEAIGEEHAFIARCEAAQIPVVSPLPDRDGSTLASLELEVDDATVTFHFALFPLRGGRIFDAEGEGDWRRLGSIAGRIHAAGSGLAATHRDRLDSRLARSWIELLLPIVHADHRSAFVELMASALPAVLDRLDAFAPRLIHGDLHRGNILDRPGEGLLVIDFDDCIMGPAIHDLWLLLPDRADKCVRELQLLLEGYSEFAELEPGSLAFIEDLRFLRMLHFLAWRARQRGDAWFRKDFPDWGSRAFWAIEIEDLREQSRYLGSGGTELRHDEQDGEDEDLRTRAW